MSTVVNLICVMAGAAWLWRSGDEFHPCERRIEVGSHDLLHESALGGSIPPLHVSGRLMLLMNIANGWGASFAPPFTSPT